MRRSLTAALIVLALASSAGVSYLIIEMPTTSVGPERSPIAPHAKITISAESDLTKPGSGSGCECVRSGTGKEVDPYLISDWAVNSTTTDGIVIAATNIHIVIARVQLHSASPMGNGIYFYSAKNVTVQDCRITGYMHGIYAFGSRDLQFRSNTVIGNMYGIQLEASNGNKLVANRFDANGQLGMFIRGSNNIIANNSVKQNDFGGINVDGTAGPADKNQLEGNVVSGNRNFGIGVWRGANNVLRSNAIIGNGIVGIMLTDRSAKNLIEANTISSNNGTGIALIDGSSGNMVRGNTVKGNGDGINDFDLYDAVSGNDWQNNTYDTKKPESLD